MNPQECVVCKALTNIGLHTFRGMIGYFLKDTGSTHFDVSMKNISNDDVVEGKTLHVIYGRSDLKSRVILTHKNVTDRMYIWHKYKTNKQLTTMSMSILTDMVRSGLFMPTSSWIIPFNDQGMDHKLMSSLFKIMVDPVNNMREDVCQVFMKKRQYVKGRYFDNDGLVQDENDNFVHPESPLHLCSGGSCPLYACESGGWVREAEQKHWNSSFSIVLSTTFSDPPWSSREGQTEALRHGATSTST